jgi:hypothetical protein
MTPLTPEQEAKLNPPKRYDISSLQMIANRPVPEGMKALAGAFTRILMGIDGAGMGWVATQDPDGQIEMSFSFEKHRPNNWQIMRFFQLVGMTYVQEESKVTGRVRHFVVQRGTIQ